MEYKFQERPTPKYLWAFIVILISIVFLTFFLTGFKPKPTIPTTTTTTSVITTTTTQTPPVISGDLLVSVKDVPQRVSRIGTVTALELKITKIEIHEAGKNETNDTTGWVTIFEGTKTVDLIQYTDAIAIVGQKELDPGKYTQIRLMLDDSSIKIYNMYIEIYNKTFSLKVPSKELKLVHPFEIQANKTLSLILDFDIEGSLDREPPSTYILKPVVKISEEILLKGQKPDKSKIIE